MGIFTSWKRRWPWIFAVLYCAIKIYEWTLAPIVNLNIENWAASKGLDNELVDGGQQTMSLIDVTLLKLAAIADWIVAGLSSQWFFGFVCGAIVFAFWDPVARVVKRFHLSGGSTTPLVEVAAEAISRLRGQPGYAAISFKAGSTTDELRRMADLLTRWHPITGRIPSTKATQYILAGEYFTGFNETGSLVAVSDPVTGHVAFEDLGVPTRDVERIIESTISRINEALA